MKRSSLIREADKKEMATSERKGKRKGKSRGVIHSERANQHEESAGGKK